MSLETGFATVPKVIRASRGLTHKNMSGASSRGYMLKLKHGRSSPTVDNLIAISEAIGVSPLTLFALTLSVESGQPVDTATHHHGRQKSFCPATLTSHRCR